MCMPPSGKVRSLFKPWQLGATPGGNGDGTPQSETKQGSLLAPSGWGTAHVMYLASSSSSIMSCMWVEHHFCQQVELCFAKQDQAGFSAGSFRLDSDSSYESLTWWHVKSSICVNQQYLINNTSFSTISCFAWFVLLTIQPVGWHCPAKCLPYACVGKCVISSGEALSEQNTQGIPA